MLVKCPQCSSLLEAPASGKARCSSCGFSGTIAASAPSVQAKDIKASPPVQPSDVLAPFAVLFGVAAVGTFYLAKFYLPFALAAAAIVLGLLARSRSGKSTQAVVGIALGAVALVAQVVAMALG